MDVLALGVGRDGLGVLGAGAGGDYLGSGVALRSLTSSSSCSRSTSPPLRRRRRRLVEMLSCRADSLRLPRHHLTVACATAVVISLSGPGQGKGVALTAWGSAGASSSSTRSSP